MSARTGKFILEVYAPGSLEDVAWAIESDTPFQAVQRGDILSATGVEGFPDSNFHAPVGAVHHAIWSVNQTSFVQKTMVFLGEDCWSDLRETLRQKVDHIRP